MNLAYFSAKPYDRAFFDRANAPHQHAITYFDTRLTPETTALAQGYEAICAFINDQLDATVLQALAAGGTRLIALRSAGYNHCDLRAARDLGLTVVYVPEYSPYAVAEHTVALLLTLNRKTHRAYNRVREGNFSIDGLIGFDLHGRTAGLIGAGKIGALVGRILLGFGCRVLAFDPYPSDTAREFGLEFTTLDEVLTQADILSLHCPLTPATRHLINAATIPQLKSGVVLLNTSRGALIDTRAVIAALLSGRISQLGIDVYEEEAGLFFEDHSREPIQDEVFSRLLTLPNVLVTSHQAFFTIEAVTNIAGTTLASVSDFAAGRPLAYALG